MIVWKEKYLTDPHLTTIGKTDPKFNWRTSFQGIGWKLEIGCVVGPVVCKAGYFSFRKYLAG